MPAETGEGGVRRMPGNIAVVFTLACCGFLLVGRIAAASVVASQRDLQRCL